MSGRQDEAEADISGRRRWAFRGSGLDRENKVRHSDESVSTKRYRAARISAQPGVDARAAWPQFAVKTAPTEVSILPGPPLQVWCRTASVRELCFVRGLQDDAVADTRGLHCGAFVGAVLTANEVMHGLQARLRAATGHFAVKPTPTTLTPWRRGR